ncbi:unnamed protein product, partial [Owenia fusiformis]
ERKGRTLTPIICRCEIYCADDQTASWDHSKDINKEQEHSVYNQFTFNMSSIDAKLASPQDLAKMTKAQKSRLEEHFKENRNPTSCELMLIAAEVGIVEENAKIWFEHRLALWRKQQGLSPNKGSISD